MKNIEIYRGIENILEDWDPIGILNGIKPVSYQEGTIGEYSRYVKPIIEKYLVKQSMVDYLIKLQTDLVDVPTTEMKEEINIIANRIELFLSKYSEDNIKNYL